MYSASDYMYFAADHMYPISDYIVFTCNDITLPSIPMVFVLDAMYFV